MTKTIKNKPKDFSIDREKWEIEYKKSLAGLQFASDGKLMIMLIWRQCLSFGSCNWKNIL